MNRTTGKKIIKGMEDFESRVSQLHLKDSWRTPPPTTAGSMLCQQTHRTFSHTDQMLDYNKNLEKQNDRSYTKCVLWPQWDKSKERKFGKFINMWKLNSPSSITDGPMKRSQGKLEGTLRWVKMEAQHAKTEQEAANTVLSKNAIAENNHMIKEQRSQINTIIFHLKTLGRRGAN